MPSISTDSAAVNTLILSNFYSLFSRNTRDERKIFDVNEIFLRVFQDSIKRRFMLYLYLRVNHTYISLLFEQKNKDWLNKNWYKISSDPDITWKIVLSHLEWPWNWNGLSLNPNVTWEIVREYPDKPWNWFSLTIAANPGIVIRIQRWYRVLYQRKLNACRRIRQWWLSVYYRPGRAYYHRIFAKFQNSFQQTSDS